MKSPNESRPARRAGSLEAQESVVRTALVSSYDRLRSYLQRRFGGRAEAEEVLQAFMLRALERSGDIRDADSVRGWLSRVLATTIADFHRQRLKSRTREMPFPHELNDRLAADQDAAANTVVCECLHTHLTLLKPEHAEVIRRIDLAGEPRELVAADLGVTVNNLTVRLHRARNVLRERLEQTCVVCLEESFWECRCAGSRTPP
ncbi:RNA polymerase sigma-70 factor [Bradyrhizobium sp. CCBAU 51745]|nr:RNA polymerase sigma-70 factor [Bradyrhizobium sp. CCBAU 45384]MDA9440718.1 RNA polymerase sigma-70 factor [Bradyrhizobium sp. CCBAU 51745]